MSSYFSLPSFARAKKNKEQLEKTNPQNPVLKDEDEKFLNKQIESDEAATAADDAQPTKIAESGEEERVSKEEAEQAGASADQVAVPKAQPQTFDCTQEEPTAKDTKQEEAKSDDAKQEEAKPDDAKQEWATPDDTKQEDVKTDDTKLEEAQEDNPKPDAEKSDDAAQETADDPPEQAPEDSTEKADVRAAKPKKPKKNKSFDLPSQEEAEAATKGFGVNAIPKADDKAQGEPGEKRTWTSYLPSIGSGTKKDQSTEQKQGEEKAAEGQMGEPQKEGQTDEQGQRRTWADYASSAYSALPSIPSLPESWKSKDGKAEPVYKEDGTIDEEKTREKQEREASVLLDHLNLSSINNRVFAFSGETEKIYERFTQVLKDTMNGGPTAYEDMEKLMKDAGPELEKQFKSMPPFVQTLVKSLPAKLGTTLGPELLAAASEKPSGDMKARMEAASKQSQFGREPSLKAADTTTTETKDGKKKKRTIPGLKGLVSEQGMVASILRNVVSFLKVRFPFLASMTNVVMSLAVFILMFVFWYCHKRGKEVRLAREGEAGKDGEGFVQGEDGEGELEVEVSDEGEGAEEDGEKEGAKEEAGAADGAEGEAQDAEPEPITKKENSAEVVEAEAEESAPPKEKEVEEKSS